MSRATKEINRITGAIIGISGRLIVCALVVLLLYEGVTKGYEFGHEIFYATPVEAAPGRDRSVTVEEGTSITDAAKLLKSYGLIANEYSFVIQAIFLFSGIFIHQLKNLLGGHRGIHGIRPGIHFIVEEDGLYDK